MEERIEISPLMKKVSKLLTNRFIGMNHCISQRNELLFVEVPKKYTEAVVDAIKEIHRDVADIRKAYLMLDCLHGFVIVKPLISEAPLDEVCGVPVPSTEKYLVDLVSDKDYAFVPEDVKLIEYQRAFESEAPNTSKMLRYASRKGEKELVSERIDNVNHLRVEMVKSIQRFLCSQPVSKAWLFGSFARMEETPSSDIDILFSPTDSSTFSLMDHASLKLGLEELLHREVDLVTEGSLLPFAAQSANADKYLIYERAS